MTKKNLSLKKLMELDAHDNMTGVGVPYMGGQTKFGSGNFGRGGEKQLAAYLSPPTQNLKDMTEEENEKLFIDSPTVEEGVEPEHLEELVNIGRNQATDLPRSPANADNALVAPKQFTPMNASYKDMDSRTGMPAKYMDNIEQGPEGDPSWPVGIGEDKLHLKPKNKKIDGKIEKLVGDKQFKDLEDGKEGHKLSAADIVLYNMMEQLIEEERINEQHINGLTPTGAGGTYPSKQGWNNTKIASLCAHKNNMDPSKPPAEVWHNKFEENDDQNPLMTQHAPEADSSPMGGMGMIGWPKQFVPKDIEQDPNYGQFADSPNGNRGVIDSTIPNNMLNLNLKEFMALQPKRKMKRRTKGKSTSAYKSGLPSNNAPGNPKPMGGAVAFEKSRENVLSQLKEVIRALVREQVEKDTAIAGSGRKGKISAPSSAPASQVDATAPTLPQAGPPPKKAPPATPITSQEFAALQKIFEAGVFDENDLNNVHHYFYKMLINKQVPKFTTQIETFPNMDKFNSAVLRSDNTNLQTLIAKVASMNELQLGELEGTKKKEVGDTTPSAKKNTTVDVTSAVKQAGAEFHRRSFKSAVDEYQKKVIEAGVKPNTAQWLTAMMPAAKKPTETEEQAAARIAQLPPPVVASPEKQSLLKRIGGKLGLEETEMAEFLNEHNIKTVEELRVLIKIINEEKRKGR